MTGRENMRIIVEGVEGGVIYHDAGSLLAAIIFYGVANWGDLLLL
jgi:hypothetical protein